MADARTKEEYDVMVDPSGYSRVMLNRDPYLWQANCMDSLSGLESTLPAHTALCTPNESGKTSEVITDLIGWHMGTFPGSKTVSTSGTNRQIRHQLYPNLRNILRDVVGWKIRDSNEYSLEAPNGSTCVSFSTDDPGMAEGFHKIALFDNKYTLGDAFKGIDYDPKDNESLLIIYDEAKTISYEMYEAFERCHATRSLIASTPDHASPSGFFFDCFHKDSWRYNLFNIAYKDCPHLVNDPSRIKEREDQIRKYGINHPFIRSMHFGEFPTKGKNTVFDMRKVDMCMTSGHVKHFNSHERRGAVDLSSGGNECPLYIREGNKAHYIKSFYESDAVTLAVELIKEFKRLELRPENIVADNGGMGDPTIDVLTRMKWPICRIDFGENPKDGKKYANARSEMYVELSHLIGNLQVILPDDQDLKDQLRCQKYKENDKGQTRLIHKDKLPVSPDRSDTIAMLFYGMPSPNEQNIVNSLYDGNFEGTLADMVQNPDGYQGMFGDDQGGILF